MNSWDEFKLTLVAYSLAATVAVVGGWAAWRSSGRLLLVPRLRAGKWTGLTFLGHFYLWNFCLQAAVELLASLGIFDSLLPDASPERRINVAGPLHFSVFLALSFTFLYAVNRTPISRVGLSLFRWRPHAALGAGGFLLATPALLAIHGLSSLVGRPETHELEQVAQQSLDSFEWALLFFQAVVFAPVMEEWLFRGLLQGWLRRASLLGQALFVWAVLGFMVWRTLTAKSKIDGESNWAPFCFAVLLASIYCAGIVVLYMPLFRRGLAVFFVGETPRPVMPGPELLTTNLFEAEGEENRVLPWSEFGSAWPRWKLANARWAIVGSAMLFALVHPWPTPIPLFFFGLVVGWLAYRTQNLVPGIVLHSLFNLVAFFILWLKFHPGIMGNDDSVASNSPAGVAIVNVSPGFWQPR